MGIYSFFFFFYQTLNLYPIRTQVEEAAVAQTIQYNNHVHLLIYGGLYFNAVVSNLYLGNRDIMDDKNKPIHKNSHKSCNKRR